MSDRVTSFLLDSDPDRTREGESQTLRAVLQIRELLVQGAFQPGERIREVPLAARLSVSRTPLRLALDRLAHEGLLERRPKGGFVAREFTVGDILDAIDLRGVLEGTAARWATERLQSAEEMEPLYECIAVTEELFRRPMPGVDLVREYMLINARFHATLLSLAKSPMLTRSMEQVLALPFASPNTIVFAEAESGELREVFRMSNSQHTAIAEAIAHREGTRAEAIAREHSRIVRRSVTLALQERRFGQIPGGTLIKFPKAS
jgi:GntR family transcriptional regulator, vanillate catabolism transcriptional regulator